MGASIWLASFFNNLVNTSFIIRKEKTMNIFDDCTTKPDATALLNKLNTEPKRTIRLNTEAYRERCKQIRKDELAPFHKIAKQFQYGDKVYFGKGDEQDWFSLETGKISKNYCIEAGQWCYVWAYQPKGKRLWLCHPGKKCERKNIISTSFGLGDIQKLEILRTEPAIRQ